MDIKIIFYFALVFLFAHSCQENKKPPDNFVKGLKQIRTEWAPDQRTSIFQVDYKYKDNHWIIEGESSVPQVAPAVKDLVGNNFKAQDVDFSFTTLPAAEFADTTTAIVCVSVANLRRNPKHTAELVDQVLLGMELKLLRASNFWYQVQTPYDYIGWITGVSIQRMDSSSFKDWQQAEKVTLNVNFSEVYSEPSEKSQIISDAVLGNVFDKGIIKGSWTEVIFPDSRRGFIPTGNLISYKSATNSTDINREKIITRAKNMMGIPYLWGGHSTKGFDCSGFTGTVFRTLGYQLPRDANMQATLGEEITPLADYSNIKPGDLIFFGPEERITHVGICMGGSYFIHESGDVHISSLDPGDELFNAYRKKTFHYIKRIITD